jgi:dTDP-glucose 4,6-dehydratase
MDITKVHTELGWMPRHNLASGLRATIEWYLDHPEWIAAIAQQSGYNDWLEKNYRKRREQA